jgi:hypothetical protein
MPTLPMKIDAESFLCLTVKALALNARDEDFLIDAMQRYANLRIDEYLEAEQREAGGTEIYARDQQSLPLNVPARAGRRCRWKG